MRACSGKPAKGMIAEKWLPVCFRGKTMPTISLEQSGMSTRRKIKSSRSGLEIDPHLIYLAAFEAHPWYGTVHVSGSCGSMSVR
jgi:hypothetical protein